MELRFIEIARIVEDPDQPRKALDEATIAALADSIRQHGVLNPITVAPLEGVDGYRIVTGERRWRAAQNAGLYEMPCIVRPEPAKDVSDKTTEQLVENLQREELAPLDKAKAIHTLKEQLGATNKEVSQRLGISERSIGYLLDLMELPEEIGEQIVSSPNRPADGNLTEKHGRFLKQLNDQPDLQAHLVEKIRGEKLSSDDTAKITRALRSNPDKQDEILGSSMDELPRVLGRSGSSSGSGGGSDDDRPVFSTGRAFVGIIERIPATLDEIKLESISAGDLPAVETALTEAKSRIDTLLAEVRAAARRAD